MKRFGLRFNLRVLLVATALLCLPLAWGVKVRSDARREYAAVVALQESGAFVYPGIANVFTHETSVPGKYVQILRVSGPNKPQPWLLWCFGENAYREHDTVNLMPNSGLSFDEICENLEAIAELKYVFVFPSAMSSEELEALLKRFPVVAVLTSDSLVQ